MRIPYQLAHIYDAAEEIAQPIEVLDHQPQLPPGRIERGIPNPLNYGSAMYECSFRQAGER
jgi:hypothetical protein